MTKSELTCEVKKLTLNAGFEKVGIAVAGPSADGERLQEWLKKDFHGEMAWMAKDPEKRSDPTKVFPGVKSILVVAKNYYVPILHLHGTGKISRYAWGDDYHDVVGKKLKLLLGQIKELDSSIDGRCCIDTAPIMEKYWAVRAGVGWQGKHSNVISRDLGSWLFLGEILLNVDLEPDQPHADYCGTCDRCIRACPTDAIVSPYVVDSRKCISYATIEYRGQDLSPWKDSDFHNWIYGCDICQDVCPWNEKFSTPTSEKSFEPRLENINQHPEDLSEMSHEDFKKRFSKSAVKRTKFSGFVRNVRQLLSGKHSTGGD